MSEQRKSVWPWIVAVMIGLPVLYILSSGPMRTVAFRRYTADAILRAGVARAIAAKRSNWWPKVYAPLISIAENEWGGSLNWYWSLFPILEAEELP